MQMARAKSRSSRAGLIGLSYADKSCDVVAGVSVSFNVACSALWPVIFKAFLNSVNPFVVLCRLSPCGFKSDFPC